MKIRRLFTVDKIVFDKFKSLVGYRKMSSVIQMLIVSFLGTPSEKKNSPAAAYSPILNSRAISSNNNTRKYSLDNIRCKK